MLLHTDLLLFSDLLLAILGLIVVFFAHAVQIVFHHLLLPAHLFHSCQLLVSKVPVPDHHLLLFLLASFTIRLLFCFLLGQAGLVLSLPLQHPIVILILQVLQLSSLLLCLLDLLYSTDLFVLEHSHTIAELLHVAL